MAELTLERIAELRGIATVCVEDGERWSIGPKELLRLLDAAETLLKAVAIAKAKQECRIGPLDNGDWVAYWYDDRGGADDRMEHDAQGREAADAIAAINELYKALNPKGP